MIFFSLAFCRQYHNIIDPHHVWNWLDCSHVPLQPARTIPRHRLRVCVHSFFSAFFVRSNNDFFHRFIQCLWWPFAVRCFIRSMTRCSSILSNLRVVIIIIITLWQYFTQTRLKLNCYRSMSSFERPDTLNCAVNGRRDETFYRIMNVHTLRTWICSHAMALINVQQWEFSEISFIFISGLSMLFGCGMRLCVCVGVCELITAAAAYAHTNAYAFMKYENWETNRDEKKPLFSVFVLPQSSRCGDNVVVVSYDTDGWCCCSGCCRFHCHCRSGSEKHAQDKIIMELRAHANGYIATHRQTHYGGGCCCRRPHPWIFRRDFLRHSKFLCDFLREQSHACLPNAHIEIEWARKMAIDRDKFRLSG